MGEGSAGCVQDNPAIVVETELLETEAHGSLWFLFMPALLALQQVVHGSRVAEFGVGGEWWCWVLLMLPAAGRQSAALSFIHRLVRNRKYRQTTGVAK